MTPSQIEHDHDILFISNKHKDFFYDNLKKIYMERDESRENTELPALSYQT